MQSSQVTDPAAEMKAIETAFAQILEPTDCYSIDFDDCLHHDIEFKRENGTIKKDHNIFKQCIVDDVKANSPDKIVLMVGSNRQCYDTDDFNATTHGNGSCFPVFIYLEEKLNAVLPSPICQLDPYLIADTWHNRLHGDNFCRCVASAYVPLVRFQQYDLICSATQFDYTKISLLYAQIHKFALGNAGARTFHFFDDNFDIIKALRIYFSYNDGTRVPTGITLVLHWAKEISKENAVHLDQEIWTITGSGKKDCAWEEHAKVLANRHRSIKKPKHYRDDGAVFSHPLDQEPPISKDIDKQIFIREYEKLLREALAAEEARQAYIKWVETHILQPLFDKLIDLNFEISATDLVKHQKKAIITTAHREITDILKQPLPAPTLHDHVTGVIKKFSNEKISDRQNVVKDVFRFLLGVLISIPTGFLAWSSQSYRHTFWHTRSKALADNLVEKLDQKMKVDYGAGSRDQVAGRRGA